MYTYMYYLYGLELSLLWLKINKFQIISISNSSKNIYVSQINVHMYLYNLQNRVKFYKI